MKQGSFKDTHAERNRKNWKKRMNLGSPGDLTEQWRAKGAQKDAKRKEWDSKWEQNGCEKATKVNPKGGKWAQRASFAEQEWKSEEKGAGKHANWGEKGAKMEPKVM